MKILQINKFYHPQGGADKYFIEISKSLENNGHEVVYFSQRQGKNICDEQGKYFISNLNLEKFSYKSLFNILRIFWSFEAWKKIKKILSIEKPDVVHIHNIYHQISPSILSVIKKRGIPIVMTVHDFKLVHPNYSLRADNKNINHKNSKLVQLLLNLEFKFHRFLKIYKKNIDLFIAPSQFVKEQLIKNGFEKNKIVLQPHYVTSTKSKVKNKKFILYFGRLDESKGIDTLIQAYSQIKDKTIKLAIAGTGPQEKELKQLVISLGLEEKIDFLGFKDKNKLNQIVSSCLFVVFPSRVHETFGLGILEAFSAGKTVIASNVGAFPELVINNKTGLLFKVNDAPKLTILIEKLIKNSDLRKKLAANAKKSVQNYSEKKHLQNITNIYRRVIKNSAVKTKEKTFQILKFSQFHHFAYFLFIIGAIVIISLSFWKHSMEIKHPVPRVLSDHEIIHDNPRLANLFWKTPITKEEAKELAKWDMLVLDMSAQNQSAESIKYIRQLNPNIIILAYTSFTELPQASMALREPGTSGAWHDFASGIKSQWHLKTFEGKNVSWWQGNISLNPCSKDSQGNYYQDYKINFIANKIIKTGLWDGVLFDTNWQEVAWVDNKIDIDADGKKDSTKKINDNWHKCHQEFFNKLRVKLGSRYIILGNGDGIYNNLNGRMFESFPEFWEGGWEGSMDRFKISRNKNDVTPRINIINADTDNTGNYKNYKVMRFGLGSSLLFDGYFSFDFGTQLREQLWTYDEYFQKLGQPTSEAFNLFDKKNKKIKKGVWQRNFEKGIVVVNSTDEYKKIRLDKKYKKLNGTQVSYINDGKETDTIYLEPQDAIILLNLVN